jgi:uncharacterized protein (TIGR02996 family)
MTATDPTYAALLAAVLEVPEDDVPRLVLADWLEENGEPERAEFIRCQIEILRLQMQGTPSVYYPDEPDAPEKLNALRRRERELLDAHRMDWFAIPGLQRPWSNAKDDVVWATGSGRGYELYFGGKVRRGFVEAVSCDLATFLGNAPRLFASQPVRHVTIIGEGANEWPSERCVAYGRKLAGLPPLAGSPPLPGR